MTITVKSGQTIFDIALIAYQDAGRTYDLLAENPFIDNINSDLTGLTLSYTPAVVIQKEIVQTVVEQKPNVTISSNQTLFDIALQYYGGAENALQVVQQNGLDSILSDPTSINLKYELNNTYAPIYFRSTGYTVATKYPVFTPSYLFLATEDSKYLITQDGLKILIE